MFGMVSQENHAPRGMNQSQILEHTMAAKGELYCTGVALCSLKYVLGFEKMQKVKDAVISESNCSFLH